MSIRDERIDACLDGELPREALNPQEQQRLDAIRATLDEAVSVLRATEAPDLTARVMSGLRDVAAAPREVPPAPPEGFLTRAIRCLWDPVRIPIRPAYGLAGVAVAVLALVIAPSPRGTDPQAAVAPIVGSDAEAGSHLYVQFRIEVPGASRVALAGSFTDWRPEYDLTEVSPGVWSAMVPLSPGVHDYTFVIDGSRMIVDPYAPRVADSFGGSNSRLFLPAPNGSA